VLLSIDTSGPDCAVALHDGSSERAVFSERLGRGHAERLLPMIGEALRAGGADYPSLTRIAVTVGPGSFTGLRVGVAAARGLALALGLEAVGIGTLEAMLPDAEAGGARVAVLPAGRDGIVAFIEGPGLARPPHLTSAEALAAALAGLGSIVLAGAGAPLVAPLLPSPPTIAHARENPDIRAVAALALEGRGLYPPEPLYLRPPDAKPQAGAALPRL